jgi:hypothetical protein
LLLSKSAFCIIITIRKLRRSVFKRAGKNYKVLVDQIFDDNPETKGYYEIQIGDGFNIFQRNFVKEG